MLLICGLGILMPGEVDVMQDYGYGNSLSNNVNEC